MAAVSMPTAEETQVQVRIIPGQEVNAPAASTDDGVPVLVEIIPEAGTSSSRCARTPTDICCVVDVSGSMGSEALVKAESGDMSGNGLSVLDIVKHALKTIVRNLAEGDRMALVSYSTDAKVVFDLIEMTANGRTRAENDLDTLVPAGMTNMWDGLKTACELMKGGQQKGRLQHVMLFTDGLPNINPPRGIVPMMKRMKDKEGGRLPCTISTFGFGYELDGELLSQLAVLGSGSYNFIPDAGFVGTVFVNALANVLVTIGKDTTLVLEPINGASFAGTQPNIGGHHVIKKTAEGMTLGVGMLQNGQTKDVVVQMKLPEGATPTGQYLKVKTEFLSRAHEPVVHEVVGPEKSSEATRKFVEMHRLRLRFVDTLRAVMQKAKITAMDKAQGKSLPLDVCMNLIKGFMDEITSGPVAEDEYIQGLLEDISGQVTEALSREEWYSKWGILYIPSLMFAHLMQQCNNFKDAGVQAFGGDLFNDVRDAADEVFLSLPAPTPVATAPPTPVATAPPVPRPLQQVVSMSAYHDRFAGCFDGECSIRREDGSSCKVRDVRRGDRVMGVVGPSTVLCTVRTAVDGGKLQLVELDGGLKVTAYHPVLSNCEWRFPIDMAEAKLMPCEAVYTFVLEQGGSDVLVEGVPCVTLGHGLTDGAAAHPFFGNWRTVVKDLEKSLGFEDGLVNLQANSVRRDPENGLVCSLAGACA